MKATSVLVVSCALVLGSGLSPASPGESPFPRHPTFTTQALTPLAIEGLTGDASGNLYTTGRAAPPALCPVWKISGPTLAVVGFLPAIRRGSRSTGPGICTSPTRGRAASFGRCLPTNAPLPPPRGSPRGCPGRTVSPSTATATSGPAMERRGRDESGRSVLSEACVSPPLGQASSAVRKPSASSRWPTKRTWFSQSAASAATSAPSPRERSRSPRRLETRRTRLALSRWWPTVSPSTGRGICTSPTPRAARSGRPSSTVMGI